MTTRPRPVVIIGAGPAGLVVGNALLLAGIDCVVVERRGRARVEARARAGLVTAPTVDTLTRYELANGLRRRAHVQGWCEFRTAADSVVVDYAELTGSVGHWIYPQQLLVRDMIEAYVDRGGELLFETEAVGVSVRGDADATVRLRTPTGEIHYDCAVVAGCDGRHGASVRALPPGSTREYTRHYPYRWVTVLAATPPAPPHPLYALHPDGFAGQLPRTATETRYYLGYTTGETPLEWSDDQLWRQLCRRLNTTGPTPELRDRDVVRMATRVRTPMAVGPVHLAGDAAHTVPPAGAKGMNLAVADAAELASAITAAVRDGDDARLRRYSDTRMPEIWRTVAFVDWLLRLLGGGSEERLAELRDSPGLASWFGHAYAGTSSGLAG